MTAADIAYKSTLPSQLPYITANKGNLGHGVAAAAAWESIIAMLCLQEQVLPAINNLTDPVDKDLKYAMRNEKTPVNVIVKNSLTFGGVNTSLVLKSYSDFKL